MLYFECSIHLISSELYNVTWLAQITKALIIITLIIVLICIYKELRKQYVGGKYIKIDEEKDKKKRTSSLNSWSSLRPKNTLSLKAGMLVDYGNKC